MKKITGFIFLAFGGILMAYALNMDTSVSFYNEYAGGMQRVNNIGLMNDRSNYMMFGGALMLVGVLIGLFGKSAAAKSGLVKCPHCAELIQPEAVKCKHCGETFTGGAGAAAATTPRKDWLPLEFISFEESEQVLKDQQILDLAKWMHEQYPDEAPLPVMIRYQILIDKIKGIMTPPIARDFEDRLTTYLCAIKS
ncbi:hypothetical protein SB5439_05132 [Klebsiella variicola]|uniref:zinc ribbon domain-containing protein n=1 Tax=Klebsiella variicola TaxID=244366 RepID=UPI0010D77222|nr:zinc ribbon domain-containing protein [Klebsiella variicola]VGQ13040.1 hypothetical protein SB5439_05132 [Klebsiella variicola]